MYDNVYLMIQQFTDRERTDLYYRKLLKQQSHIYVCFLILDECSRTFGCIIYNSNCPFVILILYSIPSVFEEQIDIFENLFTECITALTAYKEYPCSMPVLEDRNALNNSGLTTVLDQYSQYILSIIYYVYDFSICLSPSTAYYSNPKEILKRD